ncbi:MAG: hypothetical protein ABIJ48_11070, partial [Actinomycetota bacterium]
MREGLPIHRRLLRRFRVRGVRDLRSLDARGRLGHAPRPLPMALGMFSLIALLGGATFALGRTAGVPFAVLLVAAIGVFGIAVAVGSALAAAEYRASQEADRAGAELLELHAELERNRRQAGSRLHDARAITAAMGAALHALERFGTDPTIATALTDQVDHLRRLLSEPPPARQEPVVTAEVLAEVASFAALHAVTLVYEAADHAVVLANRDQLLAILTNLVDNARKYAPGSPVLI